MEELQFFSVASDATTDKSSSLVRFTCSEKLSCTFIWKENDRLPSQAANEHIHSERRNLETTRIQILCTWWNLAHPGFTRLLPLPGIFAVEAFFENIVGSSEIQNRSKLVFGSSTLYRRGDRSLLFDNTRRSGNKR